MRLNNQMREAAREKVLQELIGPKVEKVQRKLSTLAQRTADGLYPKKVRDWMNAAPVAGAFTTKGSIHMELADRGVLRHQLLPTLARSGVSLREPVKVLPQHHYCNQFQVSGADAKRLNDCWDQLDAILAERNEAFEILTGALWACGTRKQLEEHYPELIKYLPEAARQTQALAVTGEKVANLLEGVKP